MKNKNTELVATRITKEQKEQLETLCKIADLSMTQYLRRMIKECLSKNSGDIKHG